MLKPEFKQTEVFQMQQNNTSKNNTENDSGYYDYKWLASFLGVSISVCRQWTSQGRIPYHKLAGGSLVRFKKSEIEAWLESSKVEAMQ